MTRSRSRCRLALPNRSLARHFVHDVVARLRRTTTMFMVDAGKYGIAGEEASGENLFAGKRYGIAHSDAAALDDFGGDAAVAAHGVVAPGSEILLHTAARSAVTSGAQDGFADLKIQILQRFQVDTANHDVATQSAGINRIHLENFGDDFDVFGLDQSHLPGGSGFARKVVAFDANRFADQNFMDDLERFATHRANPHPLDNADLRNGSQ